LIKSRSRLTITKSRSRPTTIGLATTPNTVFTRGDRRSDRSRDRSRRSVARPIAATIAPCKHAISRDRDSRLHFPSRSYINGTGCFWATVCKTVRPMLSVRCLSCPSVTFVHCGQTIGRIKIKLGTQVGLGPRHIVLDGDPAPPPPKGHSPPQFSVHICRGQIAAWIKMSLGMELGRGPGDFVIDGDPAPSLERGRSPSSIFGPFLAPKRLDASRCHLVWR